MIRSGNFTETTQDEATHALASLVIDRDRFVERIRVPWMLMAGFGALGAWSVTAAASTEPGAHYEPPQGVWLALLGAFVIAHLVQRETGPVSAL